jgi:hypothetical protein
VQLKSLKADSDDQRAKLKDEVVELFKKDINQIVSVSLVGRLDEETSNRLEREKELENNLQNLKILFLETVQ